MIYARKSRAFILLLNYIFFIKALPERIADIVSLWRGHRFSLLWRLRYRRGSMMGLRSWRSRFLR
jgi:hypothetical protein